MSPDISFAPFASSATFTMTTLISASASMLATPKPAVRASGPATRCGAAMPPARRLLPVQHDLTTPRARARTARLRANEAAERHEDLAALITTPAQWALLRRSFASVKTEFADLDGMTWSVPPVPPSVSAVAAPEPRRRPPSVRRSSSTSAAGSALDDSTVRPRSKKRKRRPSVSASGWEQGVPSKTRS